MDKDVFEYDKIAVIGIAIRYPFALTKDEFWNNLVNGRDCSSFPPKTKFNNSIFCSKEPGKQRTKVSKSHFTPDMVNFDSRFFSISKKESIHMDPQQRKLMELTWEAFEDAQINPTEYSGKRVGVFVGQMTSDYQSMLMVDRNVSDSGYTVLGTARCMASNRISWFYNFIGPSISIDTACSSSLVACHLACQNIWMNECELAIVGGSNFIANPGLTIAFDQLGILSEDGRSKSFDKRADGYGRGEGASILILKKLKRAIKDNDPIYCVIDATASNHDGRTPIISDPSSDSQGKLINSLYERFKLKKEDTQYVECHATGTQIGDSKELFGIRQGMDDVNLIIGSIKSNLGHQEGGAGISAICKCVFMLQRKKIPPTALYEEPNEKIDMEKMKFKVLKKCEDWETKKLRRLGINSFGIGGTNCHIIMSEYFPETKKEQKVIVNDLDIKFLPVTANSEDSLFALVKKWSKFLKEDNFYNIQEILNAQYNRNIMNYRVVFIGNTKEDLIKKMEIFSKYHDNLEKDKLEEDLMKNKLESEIKKENLPRIEEEKIEVKEKEKSEFPKPEINFAISPKGTQDIKVLFVFCGQGANYCQMGKQLYQFEPEFKRTLDKCNEIIKKIDSNISIIKEIFKPKEKSRILETKISQPALICVQISLIEMYKFYGIEPYGSIGHSSGEISSAYSSGIISMEEAVSLAYFRGKIISENCKEGKMAAVGCSIKEINKIIEELKITNIQVACSNSPEDITLSGDKNSMVKIEGVLKEKKIFCKILSTKSPYHSNYMKDAVEKLQEKIKNMIGKKSKKLFFSSTKGRVISGRKVDSNFWCENLINQVKFNEAFKDSLKYPIDCILEVGPSQLGYYIKKVLKKEEKEIPLSFSLKKEKNKINEKSEREKILISIAQLFVVGKKVNWNINIEKTSKRINLPTYEFEKKPQIISGPTSDRLFRGEPFHNLIGFMIDADNENNFYFQNILDDSLDSILADHIIGGMMIVPGAMYIEMAVAAAHEVYKLFELYDLARKGKKERVHVITKQKYFWKVREVQFHSILPISKKPKLLLTHYSKNSGQCTVYTKSASSKSTEWQKDFSCKIQKFPINNKDLSSKKILKEECEKKCLAHLPTDLFLEKFARVGVKFGDNFKNILNVQYGFGKALVDIKPVCEEIWNRFGFPYHVHVLELDACFQAVTAVFGRAKNRAPLPYSCTTMNIYPNESYVPEKRDLEEKKNNLWVFCELVELRKEKNVFSFKLMRNNDIFVEAFEYCGNTVFRKDENIKIEKCFYRVDWKRITPKPEKIQEKIQEKSEKNEEKSEKNEETIKNVVLEKVYVISEDVNDVFSKKIASKFNTKVINKIEKEDLDKCTILYISKCSVEPMSLEHVFLMTKILLVDKKKEFKLYFITKSASYINCLNPGQSPLLGFARTMKHELHLTKHKLTIYSIDMDYENYVENNVKNLLIILGNKYLSGKEEIVCRKDEFFIPSLFDYPKLYDDVKELTKEFPKLKMKEEEEKKEEDLATKFLNKQKKIKDNTNDEDEEEKNKIEKKNLFFYDHKKKKILNVNNKREEKSIIPQLNNYRIEVKVGKPVWLKIPKPKATKKTVIVRVKNIGINFKDILLSWNLIDESAFKGGWSRDTIGLEFSGIIEEIHPDCKTDFKVGDEIYGLPTCKNGQCAFQKYTEAFIDTIVKKPNFKTHAEASCQGVIFLTSFLCLVTLAKLKYGETILIHSASGGVGLSSIYLAKEIGCSSIIVTTDLKNKEKVDIVKKLGADYVFNSRSVEFVEKVLEVTKGRGVDVIINSLYGQATQNSIDLLAPFGRFVEIGKRDALEGKTFQMKQFINNCQYLFFDIDRFFDYSFKGEQEDNTNELIKKIEEIEKQIQEIKLDLKENNKTKVLGRLFNMNKSVLEFEKEMSVQSLLEYLFKREDFKIPTKEYPAEKVHEAFKIMMKGKHFGKISILLPEEEKEKEIKMKRTFMNLCYPNKTYIIIGGTGGVGLFCAEILTKIGAKNIILLSRSGVKSPEAKYGFQELVEKKINVLSYQLDVIKDTDVQSFIKKLISGELNGKETFPSAIGGIIHSAMILNDKKFQDYESYIDFYPGYAVKSVGAFNLHKSLENVKLDFFILFSSTTNLLGNVYQTNYNSGNQYLEALAYYRRNKNLPCSVIQFGAISDVGIVELFPKVRKTLNYMMGLITPYQIEEIIKVAIVSNKTHVIGSGIKWRKIFNIYPKMKNNETYENIMLEEEYYRKHKMYDKSMEKIARKIYREKNPKKRKQMLLVEMKKKIAELTDVPVESISVNDPIVSYGIDSIQAFELKQHVEDEYDINFPITEINRDITLNEMADQVLAKISKPTTEEREKFEEIKDKIQKKEEIEIKEEYWIEKMDLDFKDSLPDYLVFLIPGIGGNKFCFQDYNKILPNNCCSFFFRSFFEEKTPLKWDEYIEVITKELNKCVSEEWENLNDDEHTLPFVLIGHSFGGIVALEIVKRLQKEYKHTIPKKLIIFNSLPVEKLKLSALLLGNIKNETILADDSFLKTALTWGFVNQQKDLEKKVNLQKKNLEKKDEKKKEEEFGHIDKDEIRTQLVLMKNFFEIYQFSKVDIPIVAFCSENDKEYGQKNDLKCWEKYSSAEFKIVSTTEDHNSIALYPNKFTIEKIKNEFNDKQ